MIYQNKTVIMMQKTPKFITFWILLILFSSFLMCFLLLIPQEIKFYYPGFVTKIGNQYYVKIYSKDTEVGKLNREEVYINGIKYSLTYTKIKEAYTITNSLENVHEVYLKVKLPKNLKIENNRVDVLFDIEKVTLIELFLRKWKQGVYETVK